MLEKDMKLKWAAEGSAVLMLMKIKFNNNNSGHKKVAISYQSA